MFEVLCMRSEGRVPLSQCDHQVLLYCFSPRNNSTLIYETVRLYSITALCLMNQATVLSSCCSRCWGQIGLTNNKHGCFPSLSSLTACFLYVSLMCSWILSGTTDLNFKLKADMMGMWFYRLCTNMDGCNTG